MFNLAFLQGPYEPSPWLSYMKVFGFLIVLLGACYLALRFLGRRVGAVHGRSAAGRLELVDRLGLEPRRSVYVLRAGSQYLAIASTESGMSILMELDASAFRQAPDSIGKTGAPA